MSEKAKPIIAKGPRPVEFENLAFDIVSSIMRAAMVRNDEGIRDLRPLVLRSRRLHAREANASLVPLEDPKVAYGYLLALSDVVELGLKFSIPHEVREFVRKSPAAQAILRCLACEPTGVLPQQDVITRSGSAIAKPVIQHLEGLGLIAQRTRGFKTRPITILSLTILGQSVVKAL